MAIRRWTEILEELKAGIEQRILKPGDRLPTDSELAAQKGVSNATVHRAMQEAARLGLITRKPRIGTLVASPPAPRALTLGLISLPGYTRLYEGYVRGITSTVPPDSRKLVEDVFDRPGEEAAAIRRIGREADGLIIYASGQPDTRAAFEEMQEHGVPIVCIDCQPEWARTDGVVTANCEAMRDGVGRLIERGHTRIAFLSRQRQHVTAIWERYLGYSAAMEAVGGVDPRLVVWLGLESGYPEWDEFGQMTRERFAALLARDDRPTALACEHEWYLPAVFEAVEAVGLRVPDDLEILSFNDQPVWQFPIGRSTHRIVQRAETIGRMVAERLLARIAGETGPPVIERIPADYFPPETPNDPASSVM